MIAFVVPHRIIHIGPPERKAMCEAGHEFGLAIRPSCPFREPAVRLVRAQFSLRISLFRFSMRYGFDSRPADSWHFSGVGTQAAPGGKVSCRRDLPHPHLCASVHWLCAISRESPLVWTREPAGRCHNDRIDRRDNRRGRGPRAHLPKRPVEHMAGRRRGDPLGAQ
jgi:hypothetical protein